MESDDDFDHFTPTGESSPPNQGPKLKRLKKAKTHVSKSPLLPHPLSHDSEFKILDRLLDFTDPEDQLLRSPPSESGSEGSDEGLIESDSIDSLLAEERRPAAKRALEFVDDERDGFDEVRHELLTEGAGRPDFEEEEKRMSFEGSDDELKEKKLKKTRKRDKGAEGKPKISSRKEEQDRKAHVVEYQRQLRERRDIEFKPVPLVRKPISTILEKIRLRKLEMLKNNQSEDWLREPMLENDPDDIISVEIMERECANSVSGDLVAQSPVNDDTNVASVVEGSDEETLHSTHRQTSQMLVGMKPGEAFRPPVSGTQDLFTCSHTGETQDDLSNDSGGEAMEDDFAPSLLAMNLKLDSALPDDMSSDEEDSEEDNDKENIDPCEETLQKGDPVKEFLDEEAEEENDSDDDLMRFEDEEEENGDADELDDIIATDYNEKPIDFAKRNELHQMWLKQQDEAGTGNLLQRLKCVSEKSETISFSEDEKDGGKVDGENGSDDDDDETEDADLYPNVACISIKKLKQMIPQMYTDKDDGFVSSDDEETEKMLSKQLLIEKVELEGLVRYETAKDGTSNEVLGRIKRLNMFPENKKKANASSVFDTLLPKGNSSGTVKASFLSRASKQTMPCTNRNGASSIRSFIFERDDSNSRSSTSVLADMLDDAIPNEEQPRRNASAKFTSSQSTLIEQRTQAAAPAGETASRASLFDILRGRGSPIQTHHRARARDSMADGDAVFAAFKTVKKSVKLEARSS